MIITYELVIQSIVLLCVWAVLIAVTADFLLFDKRTAVRESQRSIVRTSTMLGFFIACYLVIRFDLGRVSIASQPAGIALDIAGLLLLVIGAGFNISGRLWLKQNWGNNIKIYTDHTLVTSGPFRLVRHPLYASLIWMFTGAAMVYKNPICLILNFFIFVPFMAYRARQEEKLLLQTFAEYSDYKKKTGMFFPKLFSRR